jgi:bacteriorhodopsin
MKWKDSFYLSLIVSVLIQTFTGIIQIFTLFVHVHNPDKIIKELLILDGVVQIIEGAFYLWLVYHFNEIKSVTPTRYLDWCVTTPTMLIALVVYLIYLEHTEIGLDTSNLKLLHLLWSNAWDISSILVLNWIMLFFGYLGEINGPSSVLNVFCGFAPFLLYFYLIYTNFARKSKTGIIVFLYFFICWSLYGVVATFSYYIKNTCYNILDLFAKNFFGLFLSYILISKSFLK